MNKLWVTWEDDGSIRSRVLAREMGAELLVFSRFTRSNYLWWLRYPVAAMQTILAVLKKKPDLLVVQNPSVVLAFVAAMIRPLFRYRLIIDLHTIYIRPTGIKKKALEFLQSYSMKRNNGIIVTNESYRQKIVAQTAAEVFVLPDRIPVFDYPLKSAPLAGGKNVLFICTFSDDEPWREVIEAATLLGKDICIYISGRSLPYRNNVPANVILTGFLPDEDYQDLIRSVDAVMVLTSEDDCLVCGGYEAIAAGKPLILSDKKALREYFSKGAVFTGHRPDELAEAIKKALADKQTLCRTIGELEKELRVSWQSQWDCLLEKLDSPFEGQGRPVGKS